MKKITFILCGWCILMMLSSCSDWLSVNPKTESSRNDFFKSETGFKDALTGLYIQLKSDNAYGKAMTMTYIENLASFWDVTANSTEQALGMFNYEQLGAESALSNMYAQEYRIIAGANSILEVIDDCRDVFRSTGMYELIKGECLAIRAFCHFDILRLFGPIPTDIPAGDILAYVTTVSKKPQLHTSYEQYKTKLLADLENAAALLKTIDPIVTGEFNDNTFFDARPLRMNYYAVKAIQARANLWFGNSGEAHTCAMEIIQAKDNDGKSLFRLGNLSDVTATTPDLSLSSEHILTLYDFRLPDKYSSLFSYGVLSKGANSTIINRDLFGNTGTDIRESNLWTQTTAAGGAGKYSLKKYSRQDSYRIPLLRLCEIYFIAIETGTLTNAQTLWEEYQTARSITLPILTNDPNQTAGLLLKEYRKEFYGEGQMFFRYKLVNAPATDILWMPKNTETRYVIPLPKTELIQTDKNTEL